MANSGLNPQIADIKAAGMVQAVIASGAPIEEWRLRAAYGMQLTRALSMKLQKKAASYPDIPASLVKETNSGR
jgi:hypothetical protein